MSKRSGKILSSIIGVMWCDTNMWLMWWTPTFLVSERVNSELDLVLLQKEYISSLKIQPPTTTTTLLSHSYTVALFFCGLTSLCHWHFQCLRSSLPVKIDKTDRMWIFFFFRARNSLQLFFPFLRLHLACCLLFHSWVMVQLKCKCILSIFF